MHTYETMDRSHLRIIKVKPDAKDLALEWTTHWNRHAENKECIPEPICADTGGEVEFAFHDFGRHWRFDWCVPEAWVAVEVDGGNRIVRRTKKGHLVPVGRHTLDEDKWKGNYAAVLGWHVFTFSPAMMRKDPVLCVQLVEERITLNLVQLFPGVIK